MSREVRSFSATLICPDAAAFGRRIRQKLAQSCISFFVPVLLPALSPLRLQDRVRRDPLEPLVRKAPLVAVERVEDAGEIVAVAAEECSRGEARVDPGETCSRLSAFRLAKTHWKCPISGFLVPK